ncbi:MAG: hypothetical protein ACFFCS_15470 [Candidatus Hodarchaeota archaeon]
MLYQLSGSQVFTEVQFIGDFVSIILISELLVYFIYHKLKNQEQSSNWLNVFIISFSGLLFLFINTVLADFVFIGSQKTYDILLHVNKSVFFLECELILHFMKVILKFEKPWINKFIKYAQITLLILFGLFLSSITFFPSFWIAPYFVSSFSLVFITASIFNVSYKLMKKSENKEKKIFTLIMIAIIIVSGGEIANSEFADMLFMNTPHFPTIVVVGMLLMHLSLAMLIILFMLLPGLEDFFWRDYLVKLYIANGHTNEILKVINFKEQESSVTKEIDQIFIEGVTGINTLLSKLTSDYERKLGFIDKETFKIVLDQAEPLMFILICKNFVPVIKKSLEVFKLDFLEYYGELIEKWKDSTSKIGGINKFISEYFELPVLEFNERREFA